MGKGHGRGRTETFVRAGLPQLRGGGRSAANFGIQGVEVGCTEDSVGGGKACVGECLEQRSSQWQEHDTNKLSEDLWVQLVLVGVDTNRQIDPIRKSKDCRLSPGRLSHLSSHTFTL